MVPRIATAHCGGLHHRQPPPKVAQPSARTRDQKLISNAAVAKMAAQAPIGPSKARERPGIPGSSRVCQALRNTRALAKSLFPSRRQALQTRWLLGWSSQALVAN